MLFRLQIASDLHLEQRPGATFKDFIAPSAPTLALIGDIGRVDTPEERKHLLAFLIEASKAFETVLYVPG